VLQLPCKFHQFSQCAHGSVGQQRTFLGQPPPSSGQQWPISCCGGRGLLIDFENSFFALHCMSSVAPANRLQIEPRAAPLPQRRDCDRTDVLQRSLHVDSRARGWSCARVSAQPGTYRECAAEMHEAGIMHALGEPTVLLNTFEPNRTCALENWGGSCMTHQKPSLFVRAKALQDAPRHDRISSEYRACTSMLQCTDVRGQNTLTKKKKVLSTDDVSTATGTTFPS
jgi:hypothetical protein